MYKKLNKTKYAFMQLLGIDFVDVRLGILGSQSTNDSECEKINADEYIIYLHKDMSERRTIEVLGHELTHVKQYVFDGLDLETAYFKGDYHYHDSDLDYWFAPWEVEARGMELAFWAYYCASIKDGSLPEIVLDKTS